MSAELAFRIANAIAVLGWLVLIGGIVFGRPWLRDRVAGIYWPVLFSVSYVAALSIGLSGGNGGGFSTLPEVRQLFSNDWALLAGWIHYLAFDLFVGAWIAGEAERAGASRWVLIPVLPLTFLFGPAGFLLFQIFKTAFAKGVRP
jgi:hypothetical protein